MDNTKDVTESRRDGQAEGRSIRPVIEHALGVYFDGNTELVRTLIDRLLAETAGE